MEIRKVQVTGGSSFVITLPKEWAKSIDLKKNDPLGLIPRPDGSLIITPPSRWENTSSNKVFDVTGEEDPVFLYRKMVGAYIAGFSFIEVRSKGRMPSSVREVVSTLTQIAIGLEILEESDEHIILKDLIDPTEMKFNKSVDRMRVLVRNMLSDSLQALEEGDRELLQDVIDRDRDIDRLEWLISRQSNMAQRDSIVSRKIGMPQMEITANFTVGRILERVGDHAVHIAKNSTQLIEMGVTSDVVAEIRRGGNMAIGLLSSAVDSWFNRDLELANETINKVRELVTICREINRMAQHHDVEESISISLIAGSIRRTGEYSTDLAELVINTMMD